MIHIVLNIQVAVPYGFVGSYVYKVDQTDKSSAMALQCTVCPFYMHCDCRCAPKRGRVVIP